MIMLARKQETLLERIQRVGKKHGLSAMDTKTDFKSVAAMADELFGNERNDKII